MILRNNFTKNLSLKIVIRIAIISYLVMAIFSFFMNSGYLNYFSIENMQIENLFYQIPIFLVTFITLIMINVILSKAILSQIISSLLLFYFLIFAINAPSSSLTVGVVIFSVPVIYFVISSLIRFKDEYYTRKILLYLSMILEIVLIVTMIVKISTPYIDLGYAVNHINDNSIIQGEGLYFIPLGIMLTTFVLLIFFNLNKKSDELSSKNLKAIIIGLIVVQVIFFILILVTKIKSLTSGTYDFGLFTQMFYSMRNGNGMQTTLERSYQMSHLAVHISPIYYVFLPIFYVFPYPETLNILQILVVTSGIIPVYLIAKEFKFSNKLIALVVLMYVFNPAIIGSGFYDLHENCFLSPLLLFVIYFLIKKKPIQLIAFSILTLLVKEDASIYLVVIGLFGLFSLVNVVEKKKTSLLMSLGLIIIPFIYFIIASSLLHDFGEGAMFWRYNNLNAYGHLGIFGLVISIIQNPSYLLATMFSPTKVYYLIFMVLSLGGLPLLSRKIQYYFLILPLLLINFLSSYIYQPIFGYQYYFGTAVLVLFLTMLILRDKLSEEVPTYKNTANRKNFFKIAFVLICVMGFSFMLKKVHYIPKYFFSQDEYNEARIVLQNIPDEYNVLACGYLTTYLGDREVLYDIRYNDLDETEIIFDYIILDNRLKANELEIYKLDIESRGYMLDTTKSSDLVLVYYNADTISE